MNTSRKGSAAEVFVAHWLEEREWLVASRRHIGGAGDLIALNQNGDVWLIEVKHCREVWQQFRRADREAMKAVPLPPGGERWVANVKGKEVRWYPETAWP